MAFPPSSLTEVGCVQVESAVQANELYAPPFGSQKVLAWAL